MVGTDWQPYLSPRQDSRAPSPRPHPPLPLRYTGEAWPIRRIVGEPCLGDRYSGERMWGASCLGDRYRPCGRPSDVYTHLPL
jgi:hypothetical protein